MVLQAATVAQLLSKDDARTVLRHAFAGVYSFCENAGMEHVALDSNACAILCNHLKGELHDIIQLWS